MLALALASCSPANDASVDPPEPTPAQVRTASGLVYEVVEEGTGPVAETGQLALVHETTRREDGTVVTDTWAMNHPVRFLLGGNQAIDGVDEAVTGMRVGERRRLVVPPSLSRRSVYPDSIRPEDTLYYDVVLLQVTDPEK
jgi:FKBP-type peptidyl-prolyl cis-trans isomerase